MARQRVFNNVAIRDFSWTGGPSARLGINFDRKAKGIDPNSITDLFCGARLECAIEFTDGGNNEGGQTVMEGMEQTFEFKELVGECKNISIHPETIETSLNFMVSDVDPNDLAELKKKVVKLIVKRVGDADEEEEPKKKGGDVEGQQTLGGEEGGEK